jgi:predicted nucleic acid-binding protein
VSLTFRTAVFFDSSCLIAAAASPNGGSGFILSVCGRGFLRAMSSPAVLVEAERNILDNCSVSAFRTHREQISATPLTLVAIPPPAELQAYEPVVFEDAHVVAAAIAAGAEFLLTLDRRLITRAQQAQLPILAITPKDFIEQHLTTHEAYESIR